MVVEAYIREYKRWVMFDPQNNAYATKDGIPIKHIIYQDLRFSKTSICSEKQVHYILLSGRVLTKKHSNKNGIKPAREL